MIILWKLKSMFKITKTENNTKLYHKIYTNNKVTVIGR